MNTLNNSISGSIYVQSKRLNPGPACIANGFVNQLTVQAVDFTIMAIVIVTLLTITQKTYLPSVSFRAKTLICLSTWVVPIITSTTAVAMGSMSPVSGNWCWITAKRTDLRYALTHGWRIAIIFLTVLLYTYIWWYVRCHFKALFGSVHGRAVTYNPLTGYVASEKDNWKSWKETDQITLEGRRQPVNIMIDQEGAPSRARELSSEQLVWNNDAPVRESSVPTEPLIQSSSRELRHPYQVVDDWSRTRSPLQKPAQTRPAKQQVSHRDSPVTTLERGYHGAGDSREGIVRSFDIHVSVAEQHPLQKPPAINAPDFPSPRRQQPVTAWPQSQTATVSCTTTNTSSRPLAHTHASGQDLASDVPRGHPSRRFEREIRRMLLLNAYPTLYVLLWIPGIVNRFMEATGTAPSNPRIGGALQGMSQLVGFANALTFGLSATMRRRIASAAPRSKWMGRTGKV